MAGEMSQNRYIQKKNGEAKVKALKWELISGTGVRVGKGFQKAQFRRRKAGCE